MPLHNAETFNSCSSIPCQGLHDEARQLSLHVIGHCQNDHILT